MFLGRDAHRYIFRDEIYILDLWWIKQILMTKERFGYENRTYREDDRIRQRAIFR